MSAFTFAKMLPHLLSLKPEEVEKPVLLISLSISCNLYVMINVQLCYIVPWHEILHILSLFSKSYYSMQGTSNFSGSFKCAHT